MADSDAPPAAELPPEGELPAAGELPAEGELPTAEEGAPPDGDDSAASPGPLAAEGLEDGDAGDQPLPEGEAPEDPGAGGLDEGAQLPAADGECAWGHLQAAAQSWGL